MMYILILVVALFVVGFIMLGEKSRSSEPPGLINARLSPCPTSPNCVCSEFPSDEEHFIPPIHYAPAEINRMGIKSIIQAMGGKLVHEQDDYFAAEFSSAIFRFVDDVEFRLDVDKKILHLRSASRVGRSDLGVNKKRMERFRKLFAERTKP